MLRVRDIMTPAVVTIAADRTLREAIETLVTCKIGGMPVLDGDRVVGILAAADILEFESITPPSLRLRDTEDEPAALEEDAEYDEDEEVPSAYFNDMWSEGSSDVVARIAATDGPEWDFLSEHMVSEAMSRAVCLVNETTEVSAAARKMLAAGVQRALVRDGDIFSGILTTTDILRAVAEKRLSVHSHSPPEATTK